MANNFDLRQFLTENKLTKNAQLLKEEVSLNGKPVHIGSIEIDGIDMNDYPDFVDAYIVAADFEDGTPLTDDEVQQFQDENYDLVGELIHDRQLYLEGEKEEVPENPEDYTKQPGYVHETLTTKERRLVEMVNSAMREEEEGNTFFRTDKDDQIPNPPAELHIPKELTSEEEMVQDKPLPEYNSIEELMKEIEHGTNEAAHKYKMDEMKRVYEALEAKVGSLEEGEHAEHIDQKAVKQMRKDIAALRKAEEKLRKEFEKKFTGKEKKEAPKKEKETVTLAENTNTMENFNLKKFLTENKLTTNSRMINEELKFIDANDPARNKGGDQHLKLSDLVPGKTVIALNKHYSNREELEDEAGTFVEVDENDYIRWKTKSGQEKVWRYIEDIAIVTNL